MEPIGEASPPRPVPRADAGPVPSIRSPRVAFWGNFGSKNWGNECTLQAIVHNARLFLPRAELCCICARPGDTHERHGLRSIPMSRARERLNEAHPEAPRRPLPLRAAGRASAELREWFGTVGSARRTDVVVMTGTGMLTDTSEGVLGLPYDLFKWALAAKACRSKLFFVSVGVEPIHHPVAKFFILSALRLADYRSYRDEQSRQHLEHIGFDTGRDAVYPDLAFSLPESLTAAPRARAAGKGRRTVAVGVYDFKGRGQGSAADAEAYRAYLGKICAFVFWLLERDYHVRIIIGDSTYDEPVLRDVQERLRAEGVSRFAGRLEDEPARSVEQLLAQLVEVDLVVASRFHNVLLSLLLGKPVVSISYNVKNDALMGGMGLGAYCQSIDELDFDRLIQQFTAIERDAEGVRAAITAKASSYRQELRGQYERLFGPHGLLAQP